MSEECELIDNQTGPKQEEERKSAAAPAVVVPTGHIPLSLEPLVRQRLSQEKVRLEVQRRLRAEERGPLVFPDLLTLHDRLQRERPPVRWRIEGWQPVDSRVVLAAQFKAGKTTFVSNLARSLVDGDRWLGEAAVTPVEGNIVILDTEMSDHQIEDWLAAQNVQASHRVLLATLRGQVGSFNILDEEVRRQVAQLLRQHETSYLVLDCLRPVLDALGLSEDKDGGKFLVAFDALLKEAHIPEALLVQHMGHSGERSRGDSRLRDWPDVEWRLVRENDEPGSTRYIKAFGRDVDVSERRLAFDPDSRRLVSQHGNRRDKANEKTLPDVVRLLEASSEPLTATFIEEKLTAAGHSRAAARGAIKLGVEQGRIATEKGPKNATLHSLVASAPQCAERAPANSSSVCASSPVPFRHGEQRTELRLADLVIEDLEEAA